MEYKITLNLKDYDLISLYESQLLIDYTSEENTEFNFWANKLELFMNEDIEKQVPEGLMITESGRFRFLKLVGKVKITITEFMSGFIDIGLYDVDTHGSKFLETEFGERAEIFYSWKGKESVNDPYICFWETGTCFPYGGAFLYIASKLKGNITITFDIEKQGVATNTEIFINEGPDLKLYDIYRKQENLLNEDVYRKYRKK